MARKMKGVTLVADWAPKPGFVLGSKDVKGKQTYLGSQVWKNPRIEIREYDVPEPGEEEVLIEIKACGICGSDTIADVLKVLHPVTPGAPIPARSVLRALEALTSHQALNAASGAVHAAAWATTAGEIVLVREDVGRHNALDKLIGALVRRGTGAVDGFLVVTSRASFEMVQKATVFGAPLLAAVSGPTGLAVRVAHQAGLTLVGFARGNRLTVYTHAGGVASS